MRIPDAYNVTTHEGRCAILRRIFHDAGAEEPTGHLLSNALWWLELAICAAADTQRQADKEEIRRAFADDASRLAMSLNPSPQLPEKWEWS